MAVDLSEIERTIIEKVKYEIPYFKTVGTIGDWLKRDVERLSILAPGFFFLFEDGDYQPVGTSIFEVEMIFTAVIVAKNYTSQETLLHGKLGTRGVYEIIKDVSSLFINNDFGLPIRPMVPRKLYGIGGDDYVAIYGFDFTTIGR